MAGYKKEELQKGKRREMGILEVWKCEPKGREWMAFIGCGRLCQETLQYCKNCKMGWVPVAHACNLNYSGGRVIRRNAVWSQPRANSSRDPILKKPSQKKDWRSGSSRKITCLASVRPWVQTPPKKGKKKYKIYSGRNRIWGVCERKERDRVYAWMKGLHGEWFGLHKSEGQEDQVEIFA
jgi:hypothetical protein